MIDKLLEVGIFGFILLFMFIPTRWQQCVKIVLLLVIFEGAIRKWLLPGLSQFVYFAKDVVMVLAYAKYFSQGGWKERAQAQDRLTNFLLLSSTIFIFLQACNSELGSPIVGVFGARNYLLYIPLMYLMSQLFESQEELVRFVRRYLLISVPVAVLAVVQHFSPPGSILNTYAQNEETSQAMIGDAVRATGTFSYIAGYSAYLQVVSALIIPLLVIEQPAKWTFLLRLVVVSILSGILFSGSRGPVVSLGLFLVGYFLLNKVFRGLKLYKRFIIPISVGAILIIFWLGAALDGFIGRFNATSDIPMRILASFTTPFDYMLHSGLIGFGSGSTYQAAGRIRDFFGLPGGSKIPVFYESEPERVMLELGPIGFFLWYGLRIRLMIILWSTYKSLRAPLLREMALTSFLVHFLALLGQVVFQITFTVYYWFLAGFIFLLPRLQAQEDLLDHDKGADSEMSSDSPGSEKTEQIEGPYDEEFSKLFDDVEK